jgi:hypothetical protein
MLDGRCPSCEALIPANVAVAGEIKEAAVEHAVDCPLLTAVDEMDSLAEKWNIEIGYAVVAKDVNGKRIAFVGPVRQEDV